MDQEEDLPISKLFRSFREVNQVFHQTVSKTAEGLGVTPIQFFVMKTLKHHPRVSLTELAERIHIGNSATSGIVDRLVRSGMVMRERLESDRRSIALKLTPKGEAFLQQANDNAMKRMSPLSDLPADVVDELIRIHQLIIEKLQEVERGNDL
jgi:DNA-binding MarR family transcriptional regulator